MKRRSIQLCCYLLFLICMAAGCSEVDDIRSTYGRRRGTKGTESVNGTAVFSEMFVQAGHRVSSWYRLSPRLEHAQVIVWAPDNFLPPSQEVRLHLDAWLAAQDGRTLIYVGRDFDAAIYYWESVKSSVPVEQVREVERRS